MERSPSVELRLVQMLVAIALVAVLGVLAILPYRLYQRDLRHATVQAHRVSSVVHTALSQGLLEGRDLTDLINRFQGIADLEIHLSKLEAGEAHPAATSRRGSSHLEGTDLRYVAPPLLDREGNTWLARMQFDLSPMKRESIRLIIDLVLAVIIGSLVFSVAVFVLIRRSLIVPLRNVTRKIEALESCAEDVALPGFETREMDQLARAIETTCRGRSGPG